MSPTPAQDRERVQAAYDAWKNNTDPTQSRRLYDTFRAMRDRVERELFKARFPRSKASR